VVDHSIAAIGDALVIRYMRYRDSFPAKEYLAGVDRPARARFEALAGMLAERGRLPSSAHGHQLAGEYAELYELKPLGHRVFGFWHGTTLYLTNGAPKRAAKAQQGDYDTALRLRADFYERLRSAAPRDSR
jgi:hypothetical protein